MNERKRRRCLPTLEQPRQRRTAPEKIEASANRGSPKKAPHGVVELVPADTKKINIMSQADKEVAASRNWRDFKESHASTAKQRAQDRDMHLECRKGGILDRLPNRQQERDLLEKVIAQAQDGAPWGIQLEAGNP